MNTLKTEIAQYAEGSIKITGPQKISRRYCFPPSFIGFSGHFPGYPVLPAFVEVMAAMAIVEESKGRPLALTSLERAKFHIEIRPGQAINIECREFGSEAEIAFEVNITATEGLAASFIMKIVV